MRQNVPAEEFPPPPPHFRSSPPAPPALEARAFLEAKRRSERAQDDVPRNSVRKGSRTRGKTRQFSHRRSVCRAATTFERVCECIIFRVESYAKPRRRLVTRLTWSDPGDPGDPGVDLDAPSDAPGRPRSPRRAIRREISIRHARSWHAAHRIEREAPNRALFAEVRDELRDPTRVLAVYK